VVRRPVGEAYWCAKGIQATWPYNRSPQDLGNHTGKQDGCGTYCIIFVESPVGGNKNIICPKSCQTIHRKKAFSNHGVPVQLSLFYKQTCLTHQIKGNNIQYLSPPSKEHGMPLPTFCHLSGLDQWFPKTISTILLPAKDWFLQPEISRTWSVPYWFF
jgi:hypothetical protein